MPEEESAAEARLAIGPGTGDPDARGGDAPIALSPDAVARIETVAASFVDDLIEAPLGSNAFGRAVSGIDRLGERQVRTTTEISRGFQERPTRALRDLLAEGGPLTRNLRRLREAVEDLTLVVRRSHGAEGTSRSGPSADLERAEARIAPLIAVLDAERGALEADNAAIAQQERALWTEIQKLRQHVFLLARLDDLLEQRIEAISAEDEARAQALRVEALYAVRRRRRDLLLQLAVATQGYAALRIIEQDDLEVIWAIRTATTTTATALRTAVLAAQALEARRLSARNAEEIEKAWDGVLVALDEVETRKRTALAAVDA